MVELALSDASKMKASDCENHLPRPSYTINTLEFLQKTYPQHKFRLLIGGDNLSTFHRWKDYRKIIALSKDLAKRYEFGDRFNLWSNGKLYVVSYQDKMPKKHRKKVDLLLRSFKSCIEFGRNPGILIPMDTA